ncbi:hypothetical protein IW261DRAFT_1435129 [Armillaria novae-zelandiae]|uniref:Uncharacterized protein n=1 Tax=Armillaria novae-zelandiae TaxID=153914 RepID=A0AA39PWL2_9AGAR|nr:hypothetical protein IW261DRAFT_1435129 [Armillaria novae-zelandiae]
MCYAYGSLEQTISTCPMCKVFPHPLRCPHVREVCRNRASHPRFDVYFLKNAEVDSFNGCGFCKWARTNPPQKTAGYLNPGWPGCCRAPAPAEHRLIPPADWRSVSIVHHVPIPPDIKATLDGLRPGAPRAAPKPPPDRKGSPPAPKVPVRGSPKQPSAALARSTPPADKPGTPPSPARKAADLDGATTPRRNSSATRPPPSRSPPNPRRSPVVASKPRPKKDDNDDDAGSTASGSSGSTSDSTVTSDGGFTDYLSDESEAELQRQAEARAALVAQNQAEELEFKAARLQLTHVDLRPPKSWDATNS